MSSEEEEKTKKDIVVVPRDKYEEAKKVLGISKEQKPKETQVSEDSEKEALIEENEDLRNKLTLVAHAEFERKKRSLGAPQEIETPEQLQGWEMAKKSKEGEKGSFGTAPLSSQTSQNTDMEFESHEELVDFLRLKEREGSAEEKAEAKAVLDELTKKMLEGVKEAKKGIVYEDTGNLVKKLNEIERAKHMRRLKQQKGEIE